MTRWILISTLFLAAADAAFAQETGKLSEQPIIILRSQGWTWLAISDYVRGINEDLNISDSVIGMMSSAENEKALRESTTIHESPVSGMLVYMVEGLIPTSETIQYSEVIDQAEFEKLVHYRQQQSGDAATIAGSDDRYKTTLTSTWREDVTDRENRDPVASDDDPKAGNVSVRFGVGVSPSTGPIVQAQRVEDGQLIEENGRRFREHTSTVISYFRYHDGMMFEGQFADLWSTPLPSGDSLRAGNESGMNGEVTFYPDRIPMGFRHLAWNTLNGAAAAELQQRDGEKDADYVLRRTPADAGLALVEAAVFDTQLVSGWMRFATDDEPIRGQLKVEARRNSKLGKSLNDFAAANSRFAPILNDGAAATLHLALNLTDGWKKSAEELVSYYRHEVESSAELDRGDPVAAGLKEIVSTVGSIAQRGTLEACIKTGWTEQSGAVIYGGLQVEDHPDVLNAILTCLRSGSTDDEGHELVSKGDLQMLQIAIPSDAMPEGIQLTHLYLTQASSCLWFAIGGENASEILTQSIARCQESGGRARTPLLTAIVDLQRWLSYPQDDPTGLTRLPELGSRMLADLFRETIPVSGVDGSEIDRDLMLRALSKGGTQDLSVVIDADESGLLVKGTVGTAIARALAAQMLSMIDQSVKASALSPESDNAVPAPAEMP